MLYSQNIQIAQKNPIFLVIRIKTQNLALYSRHIIYSIYPKDEIINILYYKEDKNEVQFGRVTD